MPTKYITLGNANIEVLMKGEGEPVVMLPGMGVDVSMFDELGPRLNNAGYRTVAVNTRGVGGSEGPLDGLSLHDLAADVAGVICELGIAPVHALGAATGNRLARCLATDFPDLVKTVILLGAGGLLEPDPEAAAALRKMLQPDLERRELVEYARVALYSPASDIERLGLPKKPSPAVFQHARIYLTTPVEEWWDGGNAPMLVIQGLDDRIALPGNGRQLAEKHEDRVRLVEVEDAGHLFFVEKVDIVGEAVVSFLNDITV